MPLSPIVSLCTTWPPSRRSPKRTSLALIFTVRSEPLKVVLDDSTAEATGPSASFVSPETTDEIRPPPKASRSSLQDLVSLMLPKVRTSIAVFQCPGSRPVKTTPLLVTVLSDGK